MQCICEGSKHFGGTTGESVTMTREHGGAFSSGFTKGFDISRLEVERSDGSTVFFDVELDTVLQFWEDFFEKSLEPRGDLTV